MEGNYLIVQKSPRKHRLKRRETKKDVKNIQINLSRNKNIVKNLHKK